MAPRFHPSTSVHTLVALVALVAQASCSRPSRSTDEDGSRSSVRVERADHRPHADVSLTLRPDGSEAWHGATVLYRPDGTRVAIDEEVTLDARGVLIQAEMRVHDDTSLRHVRVTLARATGEVTIEDGARRTTSHVVLGPEPWIFTPVRGPTGEAYATPLAAWVAYRATRGAAWVRLVDGVRGESFVVPRDQVAVPTETGATVVLGDDGVDVDEHFVTTMRVGAARVVLNRERASTTAFAFGPAADRDAAASSSLAAPGRRRGG